MARIRIGKNKRKSIGDLIFDLILYILSGTL